MSPTDFPRQYEFHVVQLPLDLNLTDSDSESGSDDLELDDISSPTYLVPLPRVTASQYHLDRILRWAAGNEYLQNNGLEPLELIDGEVGNEIFDGRDDEDEAEDSLPPTPLDTLHISPSEETENEVTAVPIVVAQIDTASGLPCKVSLFQFTFQN